MKRKTPRDGGASQSNGGELFGSNDTTCWFCEENVAGFAITADWRRIAAACMACVDYLSQSLEPELRRQTWVFRLDDAIRFFFEPEEGWRSGRSWPLVPDTEAEATAKHADAWLRQRSAQ